MSRDVGDGGRPVDADVVHCHTWYTHLAGMLVKQATASRWSSRCTRSSRCGPGSASSSAAATTCRPGSSRRRSRWPTRSSRSRKGTRDDVLRLFDVDRERVHVIHNGIDADFYRPRDGDRRAGALRRRSDRPVRAVRRAHHAPEGDRPPGPRHPAPRPGHRRSSCAPASRTRRRSPPRWRRRSRRRRRRGPTSSGSRRWSPRDDAPALLPRGGVLLPIGLRAVRDHQPGGDGVRDAGGGAARWAAFRRSSSTARRGCWCRSSCRRTDPMQPVDPDRFERDLAGGDQRPDGRSGAHARRWVAPAGGGPWSASAGRRSRRRRSSSTGPSSSARARPSAPASRRRGCWR